MRTPNDGLFAQPKNTIYSLAHAILQAEYGLPEDIAMCGIIGAIAKRPVTPILLEGLQRLEYRGYDSAGIAVLNDDSHEIDRIRTEGKVANLVAQVESQPLPGMLGIAHTRWATHGKPCEENAHPHMSNGTIALVHNGIIENHESLRLQLQQAGYTFSSETDTEVIAHLLHQQLQLKQDLATAVRSTCQQLEGAFALAVVDREKPDQLIAIRYGSPLVIGVGANEHVLASDALAILPVTKNFIYLEDGDIAVLTTHDIKLQDKNGTAITRSVMASDLNIESARLGHFKHYMAKEIFEQPTVFSDTLDGRISQRHVLPKIFGVESDALLSEVEQVQIVACGTSYHAGLVARFWIEGLAGIPCRVEIASEFRYRPTVLNPKTLLVSLSQSGETADTLAAMRKAKEAGVMGCLAICNVPESSLVRESDLVFMTRAGPEIGVASTKAFTTQLISLLLLATTLGKSRKLNEETEQNIVRELIHLPKLCKEILALDNDIKRLAIGFANKDNALFLGRGVQYPVAMEGALKLKEISYIHAEAYAAGELKHGPLALVDDKMPVIAVAPNNELLDKLKSNLSEVSARGGQLIVFAEQNISTENNSQVTLIKMPKTDYYTQAICYTLPLQLLSYHVAVLKGTDVDQPRNLAKSVTVE